MQHNRRLIALALILTTSLALPVLSDSGDAEWAQLEPIFDHFEATKPAGVDIDDESFGLDKLFSENDETNVHEISKRDVQFEAPLGAATAVAGEQDDDDLGLAQLFEDHDQAKQVSKRSVDDESLGLESLFDESANTGQDDNNDDDESQVLARPFEGDQANHVQKRSVDESFGLDTLFGDSEHTDTAEGQVERVKMSPVDGSFGLDALFGDSEQTDSDEDEVKQVSKREIGQEDANNVDDDDDEEDDDEQLHSLSSLLRPLGREPAHTGLTGGQLELAVMRERLGKNGRLIAKRSADNGELSAELELQRLVSEAEQSGDSSGLARKKRAAFSAPDFEDDGEGDEHYDNTGRYHGPQDMDQDDQTYAQSVSAQPTTYSWRDYFKDMLGHAHRHPGWLESHPDEVAKLVEYFKVDTEFYNQAYHEFWATEHNERANENNPEYYKAMYLASDRDPYFWQNNPRYYQALMAFMLRNPVFYQQVIDYEAQKKVYATMKAHEAAAKFGDTIQDKNPNDADKYLKDDNNNSDDDHEMDSDSGKAKSASPKSATKPESCAKAAAKEAPRVSSSSKSSSKTAVA